MVHFDIMFQCFIIHMIEFNELIILYCYNNNELETITLKKSKNFGIFY